MEITKLSLFVRMRHSLPEVWFIVLFVGVILFNIPELFGMAKGVVSLIPPLCLLGALGMLIKQLFCWSRTVSAITGSVFTLFSVYLFFALVSELREFPALTVDAIELMTVGGVLIGGSLISAIAMLRNTFVA